MIFLDMDGVCADYTAAALYVLGFDVNRTLAAWGEQCAGVGYPESLLGMPESRFRGRVESLGAAFWDEVQPYAWLQPLVHELSRIDQVGALAIVTDAWPALQGRLQWLHQYFPGDHTNTVLCGRRDLLAGRRHLLVAATDDAADDFRSAGGEAVLMPQLWNSGHGESQPMACVIRTVRELHGSQQIH